MHGCSQITVVSAQYDLGRPQLRGPRVVAQVANPYDDLRVSLQPAFYNPNPTDFREVDLLDRLHLEERAMLFQLSVPNLSCLLYLPCPTGMDVLNYANMYGEVVPTPMGAQLRRGPLKGTAESTGS